MNFVLVLGRILLAGVFVVAGLAKLVDRAGSRQALRDFGVPAAVAAPLGVTLPLAELVVGVALLPVATAWWGALGALAFLLVFVAGIGYNLARGRTPDCHCFGQLHSAPAGWSTLTRNAVLAALAGLVVWQGPAQPGASVIGWLSSVTMSQFLGFAAVLLLVGLLLGEGWLLLNLLRQNGRLLLRIEALEARQGGADTGNAAPHPVAGLPVETPAPAFALPTLDGTRVALAALRAPGKPVLLVFSDPGCGPCTALLPTLARWQHEHRDMLTVALVTHGTPEANRAKVAEHGLRHVLLQQDREVAQAYQVQGTPSAVLVQPDGTIGSPVAAGADAIATVVERTLHGPLLAPPARARSNGNGAAAHAPPVALPIGAAAPALALPALDGTPVSLAEFRGHSTLVLFWNPGCGFCQRMLDHLKAWEAHPPQGAPQLLVVSTGTVEANRAMGVRAPVVLDQGFRAGQAFGVTGTPMAVLLDAQGRIASELAAGAPAILALATDTHQMTLSQA